MKSKQIWVGFTLFLMMQNLYAERSLYVNNFANILGNPTLENELLSFSQAHNISTLLLYDLYVINQNHDLTNTATNAILADFITNAKTNYGINKIGAIAENADFFTNIIDVYNNSRSNVNEKFDIYNLEFEFWNTTNTGNDGCYCTTYLEPNGLPCTVDGAFQYYETILQTINNLAMANTHPISVEAYVGWITASQAISISQYVDRILVHAYVNSPNIAFGYTQDRLIALANASNGLKVSVIFSSEPSFMQDWLNNNSMSAAENIFTLDWLTVSENWDNNINLEGFTYFAYTFSTNIPLKINSFFLEELNVFPNPVNNVLYIKSDEYINSVSVYSIKGELLLQTSKIIDLSNFSKGVYLLVIDTKKGIINKKVIKI